MQQRESLEFWRVWRRPGRLGAQSKWAFNFGDSKVPSRRLTPRKDHIRHNGIPKNSNINNYSDQWRPKTFLVAKNVVLRSIFKTIKSINFIPKNEKELFCAETLISSCIFDKQVLIKVIQGHFRWKFK